ncbi:MAG: dephospho-CoA kinase, partial [Aquificaceae bacterium]
MKDWEKYSQKVKELKVALESALGGLDVEYELKTPEDSDFDTSFKVPYLSIRYYVDEEHFHDRKIELFEYYFDNP